MKNNKAELTYFGLRVVIGLLFLIPGFAKLMNPSSIIGIMNGLLPLGIEIATILGWLVIIVEIICGAALVLGWNTRLAAIPLTIIVFVGIVLGILSINPNDTMSVMNVLWHVVGFFSLLHISSVGSGKYRI